MVNVTNFEAEQTPVDVLEKIFEKQKELMDLYGTKPVWEDIDTLKGAQEIRKYSKYATEELAEAYESYTDHGLVLDIHTHEELIDALHFYVEKLLISNLTYNKILYYNWFDNSTALWKYIESLEPKSILVESSLRLATHWINIPDNRLRNKEWKKEQLPTNRNLFYRENSLWFIQFLVSMKELGLTKDLLREYYSKKNQVNHFRINSNY